jgi:isopenicillin N synthase-like dioxygenase
MEKAYERLQTVSLEIIRAIEVGLQLPEGTLTDRCHPAHSELRLNHYPATDLRQLCDGKTKRTWPHTDFGIITLLFQDDVGGLELEDRSSEAEKFVPVHSDSYGDEAEMVVNISDTLERWTNGVIRAGVHRVDVPVQLKDKQEGVCPDRYSGIFFMKASRATSVGPLPAFVSESRPAIFDDLTALEYQKIKTAQLY